jgi:acyl-CoA hydrolase
MDWRERCGKKLVSARDAMKVVQSGDSVQVNWLTATPVTLSQALVDRKEELDALSWCDHASAHG